MPIRMTDDPEQADESGGGFEGGSSSGGSGGGGGLFSLLPLLFSLIRGPKSLLLILVLGPAPIFCWVAEAVIPPSFSRRYNSLLREVSLIPAYLTNQKFMNPFLMTIARTRFPNRPTCKNMRRR